MSGRADAKGFIMNEKSGNNSKKEHIYCANCVHCKLVPTPAGEGSYVLRVRCSEGKWLKPSGEEKIYKYCTVAHRSIDFCEAYDPMGDVNEYIRDLQETLPAVDEVYHVAKGDHQ